MREQNVTSTDARLAYGLKDAAHHLSVSVGFLRLEIARGRLKPTRLGRRLVIRCNELERYLSTGTQGIGASDE